MARSQEFDPYAVLGVHTDAAPDAIKRIYLRLCRELHPDRHPADPQAAEERLKQITRAYAVLRDAATRAAYDRGRNTELRFRLGTCYQCRVRVPFDDLDDVRCMPDAQRLRFEGPWHRWMRDAVILLWFAISRPFTFSQRIFDVWSGQVPGGPRLLCPGCAASYARREQAVHWAILGGVLTYALVAVLAAFLWL